MIHLEAFTEPDFKKLISWVDTNESLVQFAGPIFSFPLTEDQLLDYIHDEKRVPFKVIHNESNKHIGHCEVNYSGSIPKLSRILLGDLKLRSKGIGEKIVREMIEIIRKDHGYVAIDLSVFSWNKSAIRCYEKVGFEIIPQNTTILEVQGLKWERLNMILSNMKAPT